jgi:hypothetical protein
MTVKRKAMEEVMYMEHLPAKRISLGLNISEEAFAALPADQQHLLHQQLLHHQQKIAQGGALSEVSSDELMADPHHVPVHKFITSLCTY